jgi:hypothetical protein
MITWGILNNCDSYVKGFNGKVDSIEEQMGDVNRSVALRINQD